MFKLCFHRKSGLPYIMKSFDVVERWAGPNSYGLSSEAWEEVPKGTELAFVNLAYPQHLGPPCERRPDGLWRVFFVRTAVTAKGTDDEYRFPWLGADPKAKKQVRAVGEFAFADDAAQVEALVQFEARREANNALASGFMSYAEGLAKERKAAERAARLEAKNRLLAEKSAAAGITVAELTAAMRIWDDFRQNRFRSNRCLLCKKTLTDPVSIETGIGPECVKRVPHLLAAAKVHAVEIGKLRHSAGTLLERFKRAGLTELVKLVEDEQLLNERL
jgi:hypothetical protein